MTHLWIVLHLNLQARLCGKLHINKYAFTLYSQKIWIFHKLLIAKYLHEIIARFLIVSPDFFLSALNLQLQEWKMLKDHFQKAELIHKITCQKWIITHNWHCQVRHVCKLYIDFWEVLKQWTKDQLLTWCKNKSINSLVYKNNLVCQLHYKNFVLTLLLVLHQYTKK